MNKVALLDSLERSPVIAAVQNDKVLDAINSSAEVLFLLKADIMTVKALIEKAHINNKTVFVHIDLADGIGKDKEGIDYLKACGVDGIISTRAQLIRFAKEAGLVSVQRLFALDSKGLGSIREHIEISLPDFIEIMPGVITKAIEKFSGGNIPVIAGGLIETKQEVTEALSAGATAVSTGSAELWEI